MKNTKILVTGALMICLAIIFQMIPVVFSEAFVIVTVLSAIPIFIIARLNPKLGTVAYIGASFLMMLFSMHEAIMFLFTNGVVGLSLGICSYYTKKKYLIVLITALLLVVALSIMNFIIGIPVFGFNISSSMLISILVLSLFSFMYCVFYFLLVNYIYKRLELWRVK